MTFRRSWRGLPLAVLPALLFACSGDEPTTSDELALRGGGHGHGPSAPLPSDDLCNGPAATVLSAVPPSTGGGATPINVKVHYHRPDGQYAPWGLHVWQTSAAGQYLADYPGVGWTNPLTPAAFDDYGAVFQIEASKFTNDAAAGFGFIVHQGDAKDPDGDRVWSFASGGEFWLQSGDATIYPSNPLASGLDLATVRVHYKRVDGAYAQWGLHLWNGSGVDTSRLPGVAIEDWGHPVPFSALPNYAEGAGEITFDLPVVNPKTEPHDNVEFIIHGQPDGPGPDNKDGWSSNVHVTYASLSVTNQVGEIWLVGGTPQVFTAEPNTRISSTTDARAYWLTKSLLRWPKADTAGVFKLYHSATGQIVARAGSPVTGADGALALALFTGTVPPAVATRFAFTGAGTELVVDASELDAILTHQLVLVQETATGNVLGATTAQLPGLLDDRFAAAASSTLGVAPTRHKASFALWAPTASRVAVCVYGGNPRVARSRSELTRDAATGVWTGAVPGDQRGNYYRYAVEVFVRGVGVVRNLVTDPYAISLDANSQHSYIADLDDDALKPRGWDRDRAPRTVAAQEDMTIYELHVRDFSINDATVPAAHRGKYLAFTDRNAAGMRHLRALAAAGVTDVHLLPVFDLATVPELGCLTPAIPNAGPDSDAQQAAITAVRDQDCFNWGYDPYHYTAPEGSYATDPDDGASRVRELRAMVQALHDAGLRVGMDVVYNHTTASGQAERSVLDRVVPGYYHRLDDTGAVTRSTCCENTAAENLMMGKLLVDSVVTWTAAYNIDSFRFDLMAFHPRSTIEAARAAASAAAHHPIQIVGEGWNFGEVANNARFVQASQLSLNGSGIGTFSDRARDFVRGGGPFDGGASLVQNQGFINGLFYDDNGSGGGKTRADLLRSNDLIKVGLAGSLRDYALTTSDDQTRTLAQIDYNGQPAGYVVDPQEVVNYVENHDNQTLFDINAYKLPLATSREDRARVQLLGAALNAFSQGVAYFHAGIDTLRSKSMDQNSYNSGDWFNRLDWSYHSNNFAVGLPQQADNGANWPQIAPRLADPRIAPASQDIRWTRDAFRDLLEIRGSSPLFRLRTAAEVTKRLKFYNVGSQQEPTVIAGHLDGRGLPSAVSAAEGQRGVVDGRGLPSAVSAAEGQRGVVDGRGLERGSCGADELIYFVNVDKVAHTVTIPAEKAKHYRLHPVHRRFDAADRRPATSASYNKATGAFTIPPRTALVYVNND